MKPVEAVVSRTWDAELDLGYAFRAGRTMLTRRSSRGPLAVQKMLYPESEAVCHTILLHPPGGIAGGDNLAIGITLDPHAHSVFATPGATKWYRSASLESRQRIDISVAEHAVCEWLPQENIFFESVKADNAISVALAPGGAFCGWDVMCLGRTASGERFANGRIRQRFKIEQQGRPLFEELACIEGGSPVLESPAGMAGHAVCGSLMLAGRKVDASMIESCRAVLPGDDCRWGVTALPEVFVARYIGRSAEQARDYFSRIWELLRPVYANRQARRLRIWAT
ncbi:MAG TPA: urease accessory protein UreD [Burkholderiales bacterium]